MKRTGGFRFCVRFLLPAICAGLFCKHAGAQLYPVALEEKVKMASAIVEGRVIRQSSFWNPAHTMIFTANTVAVSKVFKGSTVATTLEVLTQGGVVGNDGVEVSDLAQLSMHEAATFFVQPNRVDLHSPETGALLYDLYASDQGVYRYSIAANRASCPFDAFDGITKAFYPRLQALTGQPVRQVSGSVNVDGEIEAATGRPRQAAHFISGTSPAVVSAGALLSPARNVLTITGNGFGNNPVSGNRIVFKDANTANTAPDFVVDFNSGYVLSWSNTEIKVRVPGRAGNGRFGVVLSPGDTAFAPNPLVVDIAVLNADFGATYGQREVRLTNRNGQGGYDFVYSTGTNGGGADFTSSASYNPFRRALSTWRETTGLNFREAGTTALQTVTGDGINIVMLDNTVTGVPVLGSGVLAITYSQFSLCEQPANATAQKSGFDIVVRNPGVSGGTTTFENGPCPPPFTNPGNIDMETVIFHELGHALNLAHVNEPLELPAAPNAFANWSNPAGAMHYAISTFSARRSPDASSLSGALYAIAPLPGLTYGTCLGQGAMTPQTASRPANDECASLSFPTAATPDGTNFFVDLRNATANKGGDPAYNRVVCTNPGTSVTNNVYFAMRTAGTANFMNVAGYATLPLEVATTCASGLQGVRVSFYETNSCPAGQAFPAPAACITITANGNYTITGLKANTTYLLFAEGVRNTKASFAMALNGTAVAPLLMTLSGNRQTDGTNRLEAIISGSANVTQVQVERSTDSVNFSAIGQLIKTGASFDGSQFFTDGSPAAGTNHYRLRSTASGGAVQFSNIVTIRPNSLRTDLAVYPNPFNGSLFISTGNTTGTMWVTLHDITGRLLLARGYNTNGQPALINLSTAHLIRGMYIVTLRNSSNEVILVKKLFHQ